MFSHWSRPQLGLVTHAVQEVVHRKQNLATRGCVIASYCVDNYGCPCNLYLVSGDVLLCIHSLLALTHFRLQTFNVSQIQMNSWIGSNPASLQKAQFPLLLCQTAAATVQFHHPCLRSQTTPVEKGAIPLSASEISNKRVEKA